jgi:hypothetical protein
MNISEILHYPNLDTKTLNSPSFDDGLYDTWQATFNNYNYDEIKPISFALKTKVFQGGGNIHIFAFKAFYENRAYSDQSPDIFLGIQEFNDGYKVNNVRVEPSLRGHNYGIQLYLAVVKHYNMPLYSGSAQTTASNNGIWKKLIAEYPNRVVGYDQRTRKDLKLRVTSRGITVNGAQSVYKTIKGSKFDENNYDNESVKTRLLKLLPEKI